MNSQPIISKIESQKVIREEATAGGVVLVMENVGVDIDGKRWRWWQDTISAEGTTITLSSYGFVFMGNAPA